MKSERGCPNVAFSTLASNNSSLATLCAKSLSETAVRPARNITRRHRVEL